MPDKFFDPTAPVQPDQFQAEFDALLNIYDSSDGAIEGWRVWPFLQALYPNNCELSSAPAQDSRGIGVLYV